MKKFLILSILALIVSACGAAKEAKPEPTPAPVVTTKQEPTKQEIVANYNEGLKKIPVIGFKYLRKSLNKPEMDSWKKANLENLKSVVAAIPEGYVLEIQGHSTIPDQKHTKIVKKSKKKKKFFSSQSLSDLRAAYIYNMLIKAGVDSSKLKTKGYSFLFPLKDSKPGDPANRRVEFKIVEK